MISKVERLVKEFSGKEKPQKFRPFTDEEKGALIKDGTFILSLPVETIEDEQKAKRPFGYVIDGGDRLLKLPSIGTDIAFYPDPKRFFIPYSSYKDLPTQEKLAEKDGKKLRKRLGLKDDSLDVIIPDQASTFTALTFEYLDKTTREGKGVWLFGPKYGYFYGRTKNPIDESGYYVANVGRAVPGNGVCVDFWNRARGCSRIHVVCLIVAKGR